METTELRPGTPLVLGGPVNFRDIGGYRTVDGRTVRRGRLFRSDGLAGVTEQDVVHLVERLGLRTLVDLRAQMEVERYGPGLLDDVGLTVHRVSFFDETLRPDKPTDGTFTLDHLYLFLLRGAGVRVASVISILASPAAHPLVFHCTAGKDRTGVVTALVLGLLGVGDDDIAADYAVSATVMPELTSRTRTHLESRGQDAPVFSEHVLSAERDTMLRLLAGVRAEFGSHEGWAQARGLDAGVVDALRAALLEPGDR